MHTSTSGTRIINYSEDLKEHIKRLNTEWLTRYFKIEPNDEVQLANPKEEIIDKGGRIYYAVHHEQIVGTVSLLKISDTYYELGKMAVTQQAKGLGIGNMLMEHLIGEARQMGIQTLVLYSNRLLSPAIHLYHKFGFNEVPLDPGHYERADIKMEKLL
jgi:ribosomal protein S18 acetylase RimI-like enzyme